MASRLTRSPTRCSCSTERHVLGICDRIIARATISTSGPMRGSIRSTTACWRSSQGRLQLAGVRHRIRQRARAGRRRQVVRPETKSSTSSGKSSTAGINVIGNYIFGLPEDDQATMQQTLDLASISIASSPTSTRRWPIPARRCYDMAVENGGRCPRRGRGFRSTARLPAAADRKLSARRSARFRDEAFDRYFSTKRYLDMVTQKFGWAARTHIERMAGHKLRRKILEPSDTLSQAAESRCRERAASPDRSEGRRLSPAVEARPPVMAAR